MGRIQGRASVMVKLVMMTGWKSRILGYMSSGDSVPDVITTDWYRSNTGLMARDESRHLTGREAVSDRGARRLQQTSPDT